jgi:hypothetical protein
MPDKFIPYPCHHIYSNSISTLSFQLLLCVHLRPPIKTVYVFVMSPRALRP